MALVEQLLGLYRERYFDLNVHHFHRKLGEQHGIQLSYTWVKQALQGPDWWPRGAGAGFIASDASDGRCPACCCISTAAGIAGCRAAFILSVKGTYRFDSCYVG